MTRDYQREEEIEEQIAQERHDKEDRLTNKVGPLKAFLGGTCNNSEWRNKLIPMLDIDYFNPVVKDWTPECQAEEIRQRELCDFVLYVITPLMTGMYSIAEAVDDSNKRPHKTIFCVLDNDIYNEAQLTTFNGAQWKSLVAVAAMIDRNGGKVCADLQSVAIYLNNQGANHG